MIVGILVDCDDMTRTTVAILFVFPFDGTIVTENLCVPAVEPPAAAEPIDSVEVLLNVISV
jgi:hypothetical protein